MNFKEIINEIEKINDENFYFSNGPHSSHINIDLKVCLLEDSSKKIKELLNKIKEDKPNKNIKGPGTSEFNES